MIWPLGRGKQDFPFCCWFFPPLLLLLPPRGRIDPEKNFLNETRKCNLKPSRCERGNNRTPVSFLLITEKLTVAWRKSHIQAFFTCVNSNFKCINRLCCRVSVCVRVCVFVSNECGLAWEQCGPLVAIGTAAPASLLSGSGNGCGLLTVLK